MGSGAYKDKYVFHYIVSDYVEGREFNDEVKRMSGGAESGSWEGTAQAYGRYECTLR